MELSELLQWAEIGQKDGTLIIVSRKIHKYFFFQQGVLIYFCSQKKDERLGEFLLASKYLNRSQLSNALHESKDHGIPFVAYLISQKILNEDEVTQAMKDLTLASITDALKWKTGLFKFTEEIPDSVLNGPIRLNASQLLMLSAIQHDHDYDQESRNNVQEDLRRRLATGRISLPPAPGLIQKLRKISKNRNTSEEEICEIITEDRFLTGKILKVVNSSYFNPADEVTSLKKAIEMIGLPSVKSIVTAHALNQLNPSHQQDIGKILQHSLFTAFIAKLCAPYIRLSPEEAFYCGILHDLGKALLFGLLDDYELSEEQRKEIILEIHPEIGYQVARSWHLTPVIQETVKFHHNPEEAPQFPIHAKVVNLADRIARSSDIRKLQEEICEVLGVDKEQGERLAQHFEQIKSSSNGLI